MHIQVQGSVAKIDSYMTMWVHNVIIKVRAIMAYAPINGIPHSPTPGLHGQIVGI